MISMNFYPLSTLGKNLSLSCRNIPMIPLFSNIVLFNRWDKTSTKEHTKKDFVRILLPLSSSRGFGPEQAGLPPRWTHQAGLPS